MIRHVLLDTGPLVALFDRSDQFHTWATEQMKSIRPPLLTCEAVLSEVCFLLVRHPQAVTQLKAYLSEGLIRTSFSLTENSALVFGLMEKYYQVPMSLADACLVRMAETLTDARVFTLDSDFRIYRQHGRTQISTLMPDELV